MSKKLKANFKSNETRPLDRIPWNAGSTFTGSDKRKLDLAILRFWENCQLRYEDGVKVRTDQPRRIASGATAFDLWEASVGR